MCGICGFISSKEISLEVLNLMNDTMIHRGPNDHGAEIYNLQNGFNIGLAQRRLSILDLSANGHQPMHSLDNTIIVVFNGEIYNYPELKEETSDYPYKSSADTEVIIAAYLKWGINFISHLKGMYAIALWDQSQKKLYLFRDRIGKKPLYYWLHDDEIIFASELKPIMSCAWFHKEINRKVLQRYLFQQYINAPDTIFSEVFKLEPGSYLCCNIGEGFEVTKEKYWDLNQVYHKERAELIYDFETAKRGLEQQLIDSVRRRLIADVPIGCLLSGGIDSSLVTAIAQKISNEPVKTFTVGVNDKKYNEANFAQNISDYLGTQHTELYIDENEMISQVISIPKYFDEPFADSSQIPTMLVSKMAAEQVTVFLSGDGGDEFFCGYEIYDKVKQAQKLEKLSKIAYSLGNVNIRNHYIKSLYPNKVRKLAGNRDIETQAQLNPDILLRIANSMILNTSEENLIPCQYHIESKYKENDWVLRRMLLNMETSLPGDILCKVDRASMKYSLEARNPLLDTDVMEYSFRIPLSFKMRGSEKKYILKQLAYSYIPKDLLDRPKKGFGVPIENWLKGPLRDSLLKYSEKRFLIGQGLFCSEYIEKLISGFLDGWHEKNMADQNVIRIIWSFYVFQEWYCTYIKKS